MIHLITGLPGSGKSLRTMWYIHKALKESRPVYVCGLDGCAVPGVLPLEHPNDWETLPDGSLVVVDECQKAWPSRRAGDPIPPVKALSEHRHRGFDFVLVTQHPTMLDSWVRKLTGRHEHLVRKFGAQAAQVYGWNEVQDDPQNNTARELSEESLWLYPKELYGQYKSATLHTVKRRIPKAFYALAFAALAIPAMAWGAYSVISGWSEGPTTATVPPDEGTVAGLPAPVSVPGQGAIAPDDMQAWVRMHTPRIAGIPSSAPIYDQFPVADYPRPHCIIGGDQRIERITCRCITQQGTPIAMDDAMCINIARHGVWDPRKAPIVPQGENGQRAAPGEPEPGWGVGADAPTLNALSNGSVVL